MCMRTCDVCGSEFKDKSKFKPTQYCSTNCGNYNKFKNALEKCMLDMDATKEATSIIRGDMFRFANILSKRTKTNQGVNDED